MVNKYRNIFKNLKSLFLLLSLFTISSLVSSASLSSFKPSFDSIESTTVRKEVFFNYLLPAIQKKNNEIIEIRIAISNDELSNAQLDDLAKLCNKNVKPLATFEDGRMSLILAETANKSLKSKKLEQVKF